MIKRIFASLLIMALLASNINYVSAATVPGMDIRYVRDWQNGYDAAATNRWIEIYVFSDTGENVAINKQATGSASFTLAGNRAIDASLTTYASMAKQADPQYITIDLAQTYKVMSIKINRTPVNTIAHQTKTEVSVDGLNWVTIDDSSVSGEVAQPAAGFIYELSTYVPDPTPEPTLEPTDPPVPVDPELIDVVNDIKQIGIYILATIAFTSGMFPIVIFFVGKKAK
ncbi:discoidin domain-containing protein [Paenibacillus sinopodophylli]|uniref:discoidin domain-containing protein n=1 Tax=Paenibacillus sinopodophylli TaxID=1837342 RepID=UPI0014874112|nr:discoidin domain-containing protein [Paenibacillus sinopodophylli]